MMMRTIKPTPAGTLRKALVRRTVRGVHVVRGNAGAWEVRLLAPAQTKSFSTKPEAVSYAKKKATESRRKLFVHGQDEVRVR